MKTNDLAKAVADRTGKTTEQTKSIITAALDEISDRLARGETISLSGFGAFEARQRAPRAGRNPQTGEPIEIPSFLSPTFRAFGPLKEKVRGEL